jgi:hypothetical protein
MKVLVPGMTVVYERDGEPHEATILTIDRCRRRGEVFGERVTQLAWADRDVAFIRLDAGFCFGTELR